jgi:hypothetical protein
VCEFERGFFVFNVKRVVMASLAFKSQVTYEAGLSVKDASSNGVKLEGPSGVVTIGVPADTTTWTLTLPNSEGSNEQILTTDGAGNASWTTGLVGRTENAPGNTLLGVGAGGSLTGIRSVCIGINAGSNLTSESGTVSVGYNANAIAQRTIAIGHESMNSSGVGATHNICLGDSSGRRSNGRDNIFIGRTTGQGSATFTGIQNVCIGSAVAPGIGTARDNVMIGQVAGASMTTGQDNVFVGRAAGGACSTGQKNILIGQEAQTVTDLSYCICLGDGRQATVDGQLCIGSYNNIIEGQMDSNEDEQTLTFRADVKHLFGLSRPITRLATTVTSLTLDQSHYMVIFTNDTADMTCTLPSAALHSGREYHIVNESASFALTITCTGADVIDGLTSILISSQYGHTIVRSNGVSRWYGL